MASMIPLPPDAASAGLDVHGGARMPSRLIFVVSAVVTALTLVASTAFLVFTQETGAGNLGSFIGGVSQFIAFLWLIVACYYQLALLRIQVADLRHQLHEFTQQRKATEITSHAQEISSLMMIHAQVRHSLIENLRHILKRLAFVVDVELLSDERVMTLVLHDARFVDALIARIESDGDPLGEAYIRSFISQYESLLLSAETLGFEKLRAVRLMELSDTYMVFNNFKNVLDRLPERRSIPN